MTIESFTGNHRFLSNFYPSPIEYQGIRYPSVEHAYQAAKVCDGQEIQKIAISKLTTASEAKKFGRKITMRADFDQIKLRVMEELIRLKFATEPLRGRLQNTGSRKLIEGNYWNDTFWGICRGKGDNHLGETLMRIRREMFGN
jgi:N-glycosidase YbiA